MAVWAARVVFIFVIFGVGWAGLTDTAQPLGGYTRLLLPISLLMGLFVIALDVIAPRKKLTVFAGTFFGLLVGIVIAYALSFVTAPFVEQYVNADAPGQREGLIRFLNFLIGAVTCYLAISFVLQTKDDFRFIVPYVEFKKQRKGTRPLLLDTSAIIDGRIADVAAAGLFDAQLIVPRFVLAELQQVADSADRLKRGRGRRGLDVVAKLQKTPGLDVAIHEASHLDARRQPVDALLVTLAAELDARVVTTDFNLNKVAQVGGVEVINVNALANALKAEALPGETMRVRVVRPGEEANQGVGFLDDGTMIVLEGGRSHIEREVEFVVTNTRQTNAGKMIFGRVVTAGTDESAKPADVDGTGRPPNRTMAVAKTSAPVGDRRSSDVDASEEPRVQDEHRVKGEPNPPPRSSPAGPRGSNASAHASPRSPRRGQEKRAPSQPHASQPRDAEVRAADARGPDAQGSELRGE